MNQAHNSTPRPGVSPDTDKNHMDPLSENECDTVIERDKEIPIMKMQDFMEKMLVEQQLQTDRIMQKCNAMTLRRKSILWFL